MAESVSVDLQCGSLSTRASCANLTADGQPGGQGIILSDRVIDELKIPLNTSFLVKQTDAKSLRLGPVIGILAFSRHIPDKLGYYKNYALNNKYGFVYVFSGRSIIPHKNTISGYILWSDDFFEERMIPA